VTVTAGSSKRLHGDDGSTIPLILGFFLIAMLFTAGAVAFSDAFTNQRDLQSICDGAALAAANSISTSTVRGGFEGEALPLDHADEAVSAYLARDHAREDVHATGTVDQDGVTVHLTCTQHDDVAFGRLIMRPDGIDHTAQASARTPIG